MKFFFDTEFTQIRKDTTLISIGIISDSGDTFYAEFNDYDEDLANDDFIQEAIIPNLRHTDVGEFFDREANNIDMKASRDVVSSKRCKWLDTVSNHGTIEFISDVSHYDFVLLIDLLANGGTAFDMPEKVSPVCHDINQDIAKYLKITDTEAFDISREGFCEYVNPNTLPKNTEKHSSLWDAYVIRLIYMEINVS